MAITCHDRKIGNIGERIHWGTEKSYKNGILTKFGILHSSIYTVFEKACIIELNADVEI